MTARDLVQTIPPIVRRREAIKLTGLSRSTLDRMTARGEFPAPFKLSTGRAIGYSGPALADWIAGQERTASRAGQR